MIQSIAQIEENVQAVNWNLFPDTSIYQVRIPYGLHEASIARRSYNLSKRSGDIFSKRKPYLRPVVDERIRRLIDTRRKDENFLGTGPSMW